MYEPSVKQHIAVLLFVCFLFKFISLIYLLFHLIKMSKLFSSPPSGCIARERTKTDRETEKAGAKTENKQTIEDSGIICDDFHKCFGIYTLAN
jgi:hypothetical protein